MFISASQDLVRKGAGYGVSVCEWSCSWTGARVKMGAVRLASSSSLAWSLS